MELYQIVLKLVGPVTAVGEHNEDELRYRNLEQLCDVTDRLLEAISDASRSADRQEESMRKIGSYARTFLNDLRG